jgi:hypothetical protein
MSRFAVRRLCIVHARGFAPGSGASPPGWNGSTPELPRGISLFRDGSSLFRAGSRFFLPWQIVPAEEEGAGAFGKTFFHDGINFFHDEINLFREQSSHFHDGSSLFHHGRSHSRWPSSLFPFGSNIFREERLEIGGGSCCVDERGSDFRGRPATIDCETGNWREGVIALARVNI